MKRRAISVAAFAAVLLYCCAWGVAPAQDDEYPDNGGQMKIVPPSYGGEKAAPALERVKPAESALAGKGTPDMVLGSSGSALTESLDKALRRIKDQEVEIQRLRADVNALRQQLERSDENVRKLTAELETRDVQVLKLEEAVEKWKKDVVGFREEMRTIEEAEMRALKEIIVLLRSAQPPKAAAEQKEKEK